MTLSMRDYANNKCISTNNSIYFSTDKANTHLTYRFVISLTMGIIFSPNVFLNAKLEELQGHNKH